MAKQRTFPKLPANFGFICCNRNGVRFPLLYRIDVKVTQKDLKDIGIEYDPNIKPGSFVFFEIGLSNKYVGEKIITPVSSIQAGDSNDSIVIRHHKSLELAHGYLQGYIDTKISDLDAIDLCIYEIEGCIFTSIPIATKEEWPGPLVFYITKVPSEHLDMEVDWACIMGPNGVRLDSAKFGF